MLSTTDAPQDQGARQHAAPEEDADSDDEPIVIPAKSPEAIVDLTSEESSEEINQAELFCSENPVLQAALNSRQRITGQQYRPDIQPILQRTTTQTVTVFGMDPDSLAQLIAENKSSVTPKRFRDLNVQLKNKKPKKKTRGKTTKKKNRQARRKKLLTKKMERQSSRQPTQLNHCKVKLLNQHGSCAQPSSKESIRNAGSQPWMPPSMLASLSRMPRMQHQLQAEPAQQSYARNSKMA